jgi:pentatricopeptide repeat protein
MDRIGIWVDSCTYAALLHVCLEIKSLRESKLVHAHIIQSGFKPDLALGTRLVIGYAKCGIRVDARLVLGEIPERKVVSWSAMIAAYAKQGFAEEALRLFNEMQRVDIEVDERTFASVLPVCAKLAALQQGEEIHEYIIRSGFHSNIFLGNALLDMYVKCGRLEDACKVFDKMPERDVVSWNAMIAGYSRNGEIYEALKVFQKMPQRNVVSWTAMIAAYASHGHGDEALALFYQMLQMCIQPNQFTYASVLQACANLAALEHGKEIHEDIIMNGFRSDIFVGNALVDMYSKCGRAHDAFKVFDKMPKRDMVSWTAMVTGYAQNGFMDKALDLFQHMPERNLFSWNAMIAGYAQNGPFNEALKFFRQMQLTSVKPSLVTLASVISACANMVALREGEEIHEDIIRSGCMSDVFLGSSLIDMYAKCGSIDDACKVFSRIPRQDTISWTAMIIGYAMHGSGKDAVHLFEQMQHSGTKPDHVTFLGVLSACCHAGLVDDGWQYFNCMSEDYHMAPAVEHYCCMVDLLGRAGHLDEARDFINKMPITPDAAVWASLLGACRIHSNTMLAEEVAQRLLETDPQNAAHYVLLSNIYASVGRWDGLKKVRTLMQERGVMKMPGCSWIEVNNKVHTFVVGDKSHSQTEIIYAKLETLYGQMKELGYVPDMNFVLHDVEEEQKEDMLYCHSEKLAIAFGSSIQPLGYLSGLSRILESVVIVTLLPSSSPRLFQEK